MVKGKREKRMRSEQWIRTQKRRVRKKYRKFGDMYYSPKEYRYFRHGKYWGDLVKAVENINKGFQEFNKGFQEFVVGELMVGLNEAVKEISETNFGIEPYNGKLYCIAKDDGGRK